jgi:hypothetical protein
MGVRMPMGRVGWHTKNFERLTAEFQSEDFRKKLCEAGFAKGAPSFIDLFLTNQEHERSPLLIRMHPFIRRDLPLLRRLDHFHRRRIAALPA